MTERRAARIRRWLLVVALLGLAVGALALRVAAILGGRIDPDLVTTDEAAAAALAVWWLLPGLAAAAGVVAWLWLRGPRGAAAADEIDRTLPVGRGLAALGAVLLAVGAVGALVVDGRDAARIAWWVVGIGGLLLVPVAALLGWSVGDAAWRATVGASTGEPGQLVATRPERERRWPFLAIALLAVVGIVPPAVRVDPGRDVACPERLECRWITVQLDQHDDDPRGATTPLRYDLWRATGARRGTLVVATGGPGVSGTAAYADVERWFDARLTRSFDIVLFDARGVGGSGYRDCPAASGRYVEELAFDAPATVIGTFVQTCIVEAGADPLRLDVYGSDQVAEDIETIRLDLGVERIVLYAESYGTVAAQRYAAAHPDRLDALILDGVIDPEQSSDATWIEATAAFESVLRRTLAACRDEPGCLDDPEATWSRMADRLARGPVIARYADIDGVVIEWDVRRSDVVDVLTDALYDQAGRMLALRALAAVDAGDWVPLARMVYAGGTEFAIPSDAVSDFAYYATWCADRVSDGPDLDAEAFLREGRRLGLDRSRTGIVYLSAAACHAWPPDPTPGAGAPRVTRRLPFPVVVLAADADPITPATHARRVVERYRKVADTYLIETVDGPHVTFGRGLDCPDDDVIALLLDGRRPRERVTCDGWLVDPYVPILDPRATLDPLRLRGRALDIELLTHPDYLGWAGEPDLVIGCRYGGRIVVSSGSTADRVEAEGCEVLPGEPMDGTGTYRDDGTVRLDLTFPRGSVDYRVDGFDRYTSVATGTATWEGEFDGVPRDGFVDAR